MLGWIFKKWGNEPGSAPAVTTGSTSPPPVAGASVPDVDWTPALAQARGDDDALLALARTAGAPLQGSPEQLAHMCSWLHDGMPAARVDKLEVTPVPLPLPLSLPLRRFDDFIRLPTL